MIAQRSHCLMRAAVSLIMKSPKPSRYEYLRHLEIVSLYQFDRNMNIKSNPLEENNQRTIISSATSLPRRNNVQMIRNSIVFMGDMNKARVLGSINALQGNFTTKTTHCQYAISCCQSCYAKHVGRCSGILCQVQH
jgi:hypothetical protein